jgi:PAS domain S-box-containing protein
MDFAPSLRSFRSYTTKRATAEQIYKDLFEQAPAPMIVLAADFTIAGANAAYLTATGRSRESLIGMGMFDAFPDNPHDPAADGVSKLATSLEKCARDRSSDAMRLQRYDIRPDGGAWETRYWDPTNWAVVDEQTGRVLALVHQVIDITSRVLRGRVDRPIREKMGLLTRADAAIREAREVTADVERSRKIKIAQSLALLTRKH